MLGYGVGMKEYRVATRFDFLSYDLRKDVKSEEEGRMEILKTLARSSVVGIHLETREVSEWEVVPGTEASG